jgi:hypothetical protein
MPGHSGAHLVAKRVIVVAFRREVIAWRCRTCGARSYTLRIDGPGQALWDATTHYEEHHPRMGLDFTLTWGADDEDRSEQGAQR